MFQSRHDATLCQISEKSDARISRYRVAHARTGARTHARTNERESIGPSANAERLKNSQNSQFWPRNGQIFVLNGQNFAISEFCQHIEYDFLKEDHKNNFHTKNQEDSQRCLKVIGQKPSNLSILAKNCLKWNKFHYYD